MKSDVLHYHYAIDPGDRRSSYAWILDFIGSASSILEIGCSTGFFSRHLAERGCQVVGVELSAEAARLAEPFCQRILVGDIESSSIQAQIHGPYEAVILSDVLEHLRERADLLRKVRQSWLSQGGRAIVSVPNSGHWLFRREVLLGRFPYRSSGLFDRNHLRFFTYASLIDLIHQSGFGVSKSACTVNFNSREDLTFRILAPLFRLPHLKTWLVKLEQALMRLAPTLFAYQFVMCLQPVAAIQSVAPE
jgi:SAM-dependent methyltransferase